MRNRNLLLFALLVLAVAFAAGCAKRGMTRSEQDRADVIAAKIAKAEKMGIKDCYPVELARRKPPSTMRCTRGKSRTWTRLRRKMHTSTRRKRPLTTFSP